MSGFKKIFLSFFVTIIFLIIIFTVIMKFVFPSKLLKNYVQGKISYITGGKTELENVSVGFNGITLIQINISLPDKVELKTEKIIISPNLFPFPKKQIAFNEIKIIKPEIKIGKNFKNFKIKKSFLSSGYTLVLNRLTIENGKIRFGRFEVSSVKIDIKNASVTGIFPIEMFFIINGAESYIAAEYDFQKQYLKIKNAVFKSDRKDIIISGGIENLLNPAEMKFDVDVRGSGKVFNKIFPSNLRYKENVNLKIYGNLESFQAEVM